MGGIGLARAGRQEGLWGRSNTIAAKSNAASCPSSLPATHNTPHSTTHHMHHKHHNPQELEKVSWGVPADVLHAHTTISVQESFPAGVFVQCRGKNSQAGRRTASYDGERGKT